MDDRLFRRIQRYGWDAATPAYAQDWVPLLQGLTHTCVRRADIRPGASVLDLATGTGVGALLAAGLAGPSGRVLGLDISEGMVSHAASALPGRQAEGPGHAPVRFERRDMEDTGVPAVTIDAVTAAFGLMYAANPPAAVAEMMRVMVPGGRASLCVWGRREACGWAEVFPIVDAHVESEVCPLFFSTGAPGALHALLARAGFTDVGDERIAVTLSWATGDEAVNAMLAGGPVALAWKRFAPATREAVRTAYLGSLAAFRSGDGYRVPSEVVFTTARKPG